MKFSHSLQFNAVPEWSSRYLAYSSLKKLIYALQKRTLIEQAYDDEQSALLHPTDPVLVFTEALDKDLLKIDDFYKQKENEIFGDLKALLQDVRDYDSELLMKTDLVLQRETDQNTDVANSFNDAKAQQPTAADDEILSDILHHSIPATAQASAVASAEASTSLHRPSFNKLTTEINARNDLLSSKAPEIYGDANEESEDDDEEEEDQEQSTLLKRKKSKASSFADKQNVGTSHDHSHGQSSSGHRERQISNASYVPSPMKQSLFNSINLKDSFLILSDLKITLKKRIILLFTSMSELKSFIELNRTGFKKILKKFDKTLHTFLKDTYLSTNLVNNSYIFKSTTVARVQENINTIIQLYADIATNGSIGAAESELKLHLREHVVWERNTVWRDMINIERKSQAANIFAPKNIGVTADNGSGSLPETKEMAGNLKSLGLSSLFNGQALKIAIIFLIAFILLFISPFSEREQVNCFAMLIGASLLWATEAIPLFVTSLAVPFFVIILKVLKYDDPKHHNYGKAMKAPDASKYILGTMWSSVIMLLLGGFTLAAALSKYSITRIFSTWILSKSGTSPNAILLTIMLISLFVSAVVSNVAAPVLCYSIIQPLLRTLPTNSNFAQALILGVAFASNLGGMSSPISSPQNIIAIELMEPQPSWIQWFIISIPVCLIALVLIYFFLIVSFKITNSSSVATNSTAIDDNGDDDVTNPLANSVTAHASHLQQIKIAPIQPSNESLTPIQWFIIAVSVLTIGLWCFANNLSATFGEIGIISLIPIVLFFGSGILTSEDWNNFLWTIVALAMGGIALGKAVSSSGLLKTIAITIQEKIITGMGIYQICLIFGLLCLVISTFISHTVSALILLPLIKEIGQTLTAGSNADGTSTGDYSRLLVMLNVLLCSIAMGLPTSGFPNVTAICMTDEVGHNYVNVKTFITRGVPSSFIAYFVIVTVGYLIMQIIHL